MSPRYLALAGLLGLLLASPAAAAQDIWGSRSLAMGGTLRAAPSADSAVLLNPAGMALTRAYQISAMYEYRGSDSASLLNVSVVDSLTVKLAAGLFYSYGHAAPNRLIALGAGQTFQLSETSNTHEVGLALAYPLGSLIYLGVTPKYVTHSVSQPEDTPAELTNSGTSGFTMDVGAIINPISTLNLAVTGMNLIPLDNLVYPRLLGLGVSYAFGTTFLAEFDTVLNFSTTESIKPSYHAGAELFLGQAYAIRAGYMYDTIRQANYVTGGLGLVSKMIAVDASLRQMVSGGAETTFAASIRVFLN